MVLVLLAEDVVFSQVSVHSLGVVEPPPRTAKQHPIKAGHHTLDILLEFGDKLLHGVSPWFFVEDLDIQQRTPSEERQHCLRLAAMWGRMASGMASCAPIGNRRNGGLTTRLQV